MLDSAYGYVLDSYLHLCRNKREMNPEGTMFWVLKLPHPWPPVRDYLIYGEEDMELVALTDGRLG